MATAIIRPDGDQGTNEWNVYGTCPLHHDCVDEDCTNPDTGCADSNYLGASELDDGNVEIFTLDNVPASVGTITAIIALAWAGQGPSGGNAFIQYRVGGGSWSATRQFGGLSITYAWVGSSGGWTGLSLTKANGDALQMRMQAATGKFMSININVIYFLITYTSTTSIAKINDVSLSNIAKINDIAKANIAKWNDIT